MVENGRLVTFDLLLSNSVFQKTTYGIRRILHQEKFTRGGNSTGYISTGDISTGGFYTRENYTGDIYTLIGDIYTRRYLHHGFLHPEIFTLEKITHKTEKITLYEKKYKKSYY